MSPIVRLLKPLASLRLTVVLFAMAMFLIFAGTLAQVHEGVWTVVDRYFRSLLVRIDLQVFVPTSLGRVPGAFFFPGGFLIASALLFNLIAAHTVRFKFSARRIGIIVTHAGVILLLVGEFVTGLAATEGHMSIYQNSFSDFVEDIRTAEIAVIDSSDPGDDLVVVVPARMLARAKQPISHSLLPFQIRIDQWMPNSRILGPMQAPAETRARADKGIGTTVSAVPAAPTTGIDNGASDIPSAYVTLLRNGERLGSYLLSAYLDQPQPVEVGGRTYGLQLRFKRTYKPYTVHLLEFRHDKFVGTETARNFSSRVRLVDPANQVDREVLISMNNPLRYGGETFYQSAFKENDTGTVLQVVRNPGWLLPYFSCALVGLGMLIHFGMRLAPAVRRRTA